MYLGRYTSNIMLKASRYIVILYGVQYMVTLYGVVDQPTRTIMCYSVFMITYKVRHTPYCYIRAHKRKFNSIITYIIVWIVSDTFRK